MTSAKLRKAVMDSHVAAITVVILLFELIDAAFVEVLPAVSHILYGGLRNMEMRHDPFFHPPLDTAPDYALLLGQLVGWVFYVCLSLVAAWALCQWAYRAGPFNSLAQLRNRLSKGSPEVPSA
jgi:hypothetical protein